MRYILIIFAFVVGFQYSEQIQTETIGHLDEKTPILVDKKGKITYNLFGPIKMKNFQPLIDVLNDAKYGDKVEIYIDSGGGKVLQGLRIIEAIKNSKAITTCNVERLAASMAADILFNCDYIVLNPNAKVIIHLMHYGNVGTGYIRSGELNEYSYNEYIKNYKLDEALSTERLFKLALGYDLYLQMHEIRKIVNHNRLMMNRNLSY